MKLLQIVITGLTGLLFGIGLLLSGMANPAKVLGFLSLDNWDPSLALVMAGAIVVGLLGFSFAKSLKQSLLKKTMQWPTARHVDRRLIIGSALFGCGWGIAGICPGPALVLLGAAEIKGLVFVLSMLGGMLIFEAFMASSRARV